jgi:hypothetical protein
MSSTLGWLLSCVLNKENFYCLPSSNGRGMTLVSTTSVWETNLVPNQALTQSSAPLHPLYSLKWPYTKHNERNATDWKWLRDIQRLKKFTIKRICF